MIRSLPDILSSGKVDLKEPRAHPKMRAYPKRERREPSTGVKAPPAPPGRVSIQLEGEDDRKAQ
jgi:hypothetical protein